MGFCIWLVGLEGNEGRGCVGWEVLSRAVVHEGRGCVVSLAVVYEGVLSQAAVYEEG